MADSQGHGQGRDRIGLYSGLNSDVLAQQSAYPQHVTAMTPAGLEPAASGLGIPRSIHLSYGAARHTGT